MLHRRMLLGALGLLVVAPALARGASLMPPAEPRAKLYREGVFDLEGWLEVHAGDPGLEMTFDQMPIRICGFITDIKRWEITGPLSEVMKLREPRDQIILGPDERYGVFGERRVLRRLPHSPAPSALRSDPSF